MRPSQRCSDDDVEKGTDSRYHERRTTEISGLDQEYGVKERGAKDASKVCGLMELPSPEIRKAKDRTGLEDMG